jgi:hypothetical protein
MASIIESDRRFDTKLENWSVNDLVRRYTPPTKEFPDGNGRLFLPPSQRQWSWIGKNRVKKQEKLIDSVLHNYPIPSIILNFREGAADRWEIYDGRHRIETLWNFKNNRFSICGKFYKDFDEHDKRYFDERLLPVIVTSQATPSQLADVFLRLNSGTPLKSHDYCWAAKDTPLVSKTCKILESERDRFFPLFGDLEITNRKSLPNWVSIMAGVSCNNAGFMTTAFERLSTEGDDSNGKGLDRCPTDEQAISAMDALYRLYSGFLSSSEDLKIKPSDRRKFATVGFINAYFLHDWMEEIKTEGGTGETSIQNWMKVLRFIHENPKEGNKLRSVSGAQNLNMAKILKVVHNVHTWLETGVVDGDETDSDIDDE